jgi:hypothetical protein
MDAEHEGPEPGGEVQVPQRPRTVEAPGHEVGHESAQIVCIGVDDVLGDVEAGVVDPGGTVTRLEPPAQTRSGVQPLGDVGAQVVERRRGLELDHLARVPGDDPALEAEDALVVLGEPVRDGVRSSGVAGA